MKIGILGSGNVGQTLAKGLQGLGHSVQIGSREGNKLAAFSAETGIKEGTFAEVAAEAELVILALLGEFAEEVVTGVAASLAGKVVLDATNPIKHSGIKGGILQYFTAANESLLERLQQIAPQAKLVKCFNSVGAHLMIKPKLQGGTPAMFICGDDDGAKATAAALVETLGWQAQDMGTSAAGHALEALCQLWCAPGLLRNDWMHAFAVLRP